MEHKKIGAGIILFNKQTGDILLGKRSFGSPNGNTYSPFGGTFELRDLNPKQTAKREVKEESGINSNEYKMSTSPFYVQDTPNLIFYTYLGILSEQSIVTIDKEHTTYGWYPLDHLPSNLHPGFQELISHKKSELENIINKIKTNKNEKPN